MTCRMTCKRPRRLRVDVLHAPTTHWLKYALVVLVRDAISQRKVQCVVLSLAYANILNGMLQRNSVIARQMDVPVVRLYQGSILRTCGN